MSVTLPSSVERERHRRHTLAVSAAVRDAGPNWGIIGQKRRGRVALQGLPKITGEIDWNGAFAAHNVVTNDGGSFRFARPDNQSYSMSTAAWLMRDAVS
jgi:hypothetical protein